MNATSPPRQALSALAARVDKAALGVMQRVWLSGGDPTQERARTKQTQIFETYTDPALRSRPLDFFPEPGPADLETRWWLPILGGRRLRVRWNSGYRTWDQSYRDEYDGYQANRTAWAEWWSHGVAGRPTAICIHSWATPHFLLQREVFAVRKLFRDGWDVVLPVLPFHGPRTPKQAMFGGQLFPGTNPQRTNEAFGQSAWDVRALMGALRERGSGPIGVMGVSLGGYTSAMLAGLEPDLAFAIPIVPMVSFGDLLWHHGRGGAHRARAEASGVTLERLQEVYGVHAPLSMKPLLPVERRMIIAGRGDRVCPPDHVERLREHWDHPKMVWFDGGHIVHFGRRGMLRELRGFLREIQSGTR
jgi:pimeloyl-ACP methyl ester carboxylesterase